MRDRQKRRRQRLWLERIVIAVLVPFSRLYLGVHTPFDVAAAAAAAVALLLPHHRSLRLSL